SKRRHTIFKCDWSSDVCSSDLATSCGLESQTVQIRVLKTPAECGIIRRVFIVSSPLQEQSPMAEQANSRGEIFVVDDDPAVRDTLSMVLSAGGYEVICFADGAALLAVARSRTPACILLDVHIRSEERRVGKEWASK